MTLKTRVMAAENSALSSSNTVNYISICIEVKTGRLFQIVILFHNITVFDQIIVALFQKLLLIPNF